MSQHFIINLVQWDVFQGQWEEYKDPDEALEESESYYLDDDHYSASCWFGAIYEFLKAAKTNSGITIRIG